jgi:hypothetical protein
MPSGEASIWVVSSVLVALRPDLARLRALLVNSLAAAGDLPGAIAAANEAIAAGIGVNELIGLRDRLARQGAPSPVPPPPAAPPAAAAPAAPPPAAPAPVDEAFAAADAGYKAFARKDYAAAIADARRAIALPKSAVGRSICKATAARAPWKPIAYSASIRRPSSRLEGAIAILGIEVEQHDPALPGFGEIPGGIDRDRGGADATADAKNEDELSRAAAGLSGAARQNAVAGAGHQVADQRLEKILHNARMLEAAVKDNVIAVADHYDTGIRLANVGERTDAGYRIGDSANVYN